MIDDLVRAGKDGPLAGQVLLAMPGMEDERFHRAVIFICAHSAHGAMGFVVNKPDYRISLPDLLLQLEMIGLEEARQLPQKALQLPIMAGGPVETRRGFVLHSQDGLVEGSSVAVGPDLAVTLTLDILRLIAEGRGPNRAHLMLGCALWGPGQIEAEIAQNAWLTTSLDPALLLSTGQAHKYTAALKEMGIDLAFLTAHAGHG